MKHYTWQTFEDLERDSKIVYTNRCGEFCDALLEKIKSALAKEMQVESQAIVIGQEDWGWYLEFQKDQVHYELDVSYQERNAENAHQFGVTVDAQKIVKRIVFNRKTLAKDELREFAEAIVSVAKRNSIEIFEE